VHAALVKWLMIPDAEGLPDFEDFIRRPEWQRLAACRGEGTGAFIVGLGGGTYAKAKELCASCSVRQECLETALADEELVGLWGGLTAKERVRLRRGVA
jgi:WhiB family redox-sensing transcriptional regulator